MGIRHTAQERQITRLVGNTKNDSRYTITPELQYSIAPILHYSTTPILHHSITECRTPNAEYRMPSPITLHQVFPVPNTQYLIPNTPSPNAERRIPNAFPYTLHQVFPVPNTEYPIPNTPSIQFFINQCPGNVEIFFVSDFNVAPAAPDYLDRRSQPFHQRRIISALETVQAGLVVRLFD